jgi:endoglucanase
VKHFFKPTFFTFAVCLSLVVTNTSALAAVPDTATPKRPFPQHTVYAAGAIKPKFVDGATKPTLLLPAQLDAITANRYVAWRKAYLKTGCGAGRNYIYVAKGITSLKSDVNRDTLTVSEGHGYGMLIFAWMAGYDVNAKKYFDGMVRYWQDHPAKSNKSLMAWNQVKGCKNATKNPAGETVNGSGTATDGDLDIAYALLLADKQWGSTGTFNYRQLAVAVIQAMLVHEINPVTHHVLLGDWVKPTEPEFYYATRPSDFMLSHFRAFQAATNHGEWTNVINKTYDIIKTMQTRFSPATGLLPDFVVAIQTGARPPIGEFLEAPSDGWYAYNSCRTPWRIGMDFLLYGEPKARTAVGKINAWIKTKTGGNPEKILDGYKLNGVAFGTGDDLAFVAPFGVSAMASSVNQAWLDKLWAGITARKVSDTDYFGETLTMLSLIAMSGNAWKP